MKKLLLTGVGLVTLLFAMVGCVGTTDGLGPRIDSITAELMMEQQPTEQTPVPTGQTPTPTTVQQQEIISVTIQISVSNFAIVDTIGVSGAGEGDGYYIYYLDRLPANLQEAIPEFQQPITETPTPAPTPGQQQRQETAWASTETSFTWENLSQGVHIFSVQLVDPFGVPLTPPVIAAVALTIPGSLSTTQ